MGAGRSVAGDDAEGWRPLIKDPVVLAAGLHRLAEAARRCFVAAGYSSTTVNDVADAAGMSVGSVYKYIRAKEDLLAVIAADAHQLLASDLRRAVDDVPTATGALLMALRANLQSCQDNRDLVRLFFEEFRYMPAETRRLIRRQEVAVISVIESVIVRGNDGGEFSCVEPHLAAVHLTAQATTWAMKRKHLFPDVSLEEFVEVMERCALDVVGARVDPSEVSRETGPERVVRTGRWSQDRAGGVE